MRIIFAGVELAGWYDNPAMSVSVNGAQVVDPVDIVGAATKRIYSRGAASISLDFSARRKFSTLKEAEVFVMTGFSTMTLAGLAEIQCGVSTDYQSVYIANAVLESTPSTTHFGLVADVSYRIIGGEATTDTPPQFLLGGEDMILKSSDAIANGATYHDVTFATVFSAAPVVTATVGMPSGGDHIWPTIRDDLVTTSGFRAEFSGTIPATGYKLNWSAFGA